LWRYAVALNSYLTKQLETASLIQLLLLTGCIAGVVYLTLPVIIATAHFGIPVVERVITPLLCIAAWVLFRTLGTYSQTDEQFATTVLEAREQWNATCLSPRSKEQGAKNRLLSKATFRIAAAIRERLPDLHLNPTAANKRAAHYEGLEFIRREQKEGRWKDLREEHRGQHIRAAVALVFIPDDLDVQLARMENTLTVSVQKERGVKGYASLTTRLKLFLTGHIPVVEQSNSGARLTSTPSEQVQVTMCEMPSDATSRTV
jgi:hypothetical protein